MNFKTLALATAVAAFSFSAQADNIFFAGAQAFSGSGSVDFDVEDPRGITYSTSWDTDQTGQKLFFGLERSDGDRTVFSYTTIDAEAEDSLDIEITGFDVDWTFGFAQSDVVTPYALAGFGYYTWKDSAELFGLVADDDLNGIALNFGIGAAFKVHEAIELDASYSYKGIFWQQMEDATGTTVDVSSTSYDLMLGARFLF